jgi:hypothetical protein
MSFREKSAWVMGALILVSGLFYVRLMLATSGYATSPVAIFVPYTIAVIVGSIIVQVVLAVLSPKEASASADERERVVLDKSGHWSGIVLAFGAVGGALHYMWNGAGDQLFHAVILSLSVSQLAEYACQIFLFRRGV